jgi:hypothetical protein
MDPFKLAERYIQLRTYYSTPSLGDTMMRLNEMILSPLITLTFLCLGSLDFVSLVSAIVATYRAWSQWVEYSDLRIHMQRMYLTTMASGGPQIVTNDPTYLPYVYADAVVRLGSPRLGSARVPRQRVAPWTRIAPRSPVPATPSHQIHTQPHPPTATARRPASCDDGSSSPSSTPS